MIRSWNLHSPSEWARVLREDADDEGRWRALDALRHVGKAEETINPFLEALEDRYWRVRALAAHALYDLILDEDGLVKRAEVIESLTSALGDQCLEVSCIAAYALGALGPAALSSTPRLRQVAEEDPARLREAAAEALSAVLV